MRTRARGHDVVVVVSAMGDTTDELLAMAKQVSPNPDRRELDMLLSAGERISMALLSMAIRELGGDAISFTGSQSGIITNDRHVDARIIEVRPFRVQDELARGRIVVIAGYQGVSYKREVTTLGRGGSDTTAVAMAAALDAEYCEICSDVDGVYSADPRVVPAAQRIGALSYEETQEMAEAGAKVLNAQAVEFAKDKGIAIYARATRGPAARGRPVSRRHGGAQAPATHARHGRRRRQRARSGDARGDGTGRPTCWPCSTSAASPASNCTSSTIGPRWRSRARTCTTKTSCATRSQIRLGGRARLVDGLAAVSVIGAGINATYANVRAGAAALADVGIIPVGTATSSFRITWMVPRQRSNEAVVALHGRFLEAPPPLLP